MNYCLILPNALLYPVTWSHGLISVASLHCCPLHSPHPYPALLPRLASPMGSWPKSPFLGCLRPCLSCFPGAEVHATVNELSNTVKRVIGKAQKHHLSDNHIPSPSLTPNLPGVTFLVGFGRFDILPLPPLDTDPGMPLVFISPDYPWVWSLSIWNACVPRLLLCSVSEIRMIKRKNDFSKAASSHIFVFCKINNIKAMQTKLLNYLNLNVRAFYILPLLLNICWVISQRVCRVKKAPLCPAVSFACGFLYGRNVIPDFVRQGEMLC